jgi:hypothetical protein
MTVTAELWTCPDCTVTERLTPTVVDGTLLDVDELRRRVQAGHGSRHAAERRQVTDLTTALIEATERIAAFRVRLVVPPGEVERVRSIIVRRSLPIEVFADGTLTDGQAYVAQPRAGVRELRGRP